MPHAHAHLSLPFFAADWLLFPGHYQRLSLRASLRIELRTENSGLDRLFEGLQRALGGPPKVRLPSSTSARRVAARMRA